MKNYKILDCAKCGEEFTQRITQDRKCNSCIAAEARAKYDPVKERNRKYIAKYGITLDDYNIMYDKQSGRCKICREPNHKLHIDHNHTTGEVRALLCSNCNTGIGMFKEDILFLKSAIDYIKKYNK